ncbi:polyribonucleotide nucleotidyltransferase [Anaplasma bovis]|uniref:polyribonucleotide nucleotidyltransferase n=1 Tax=Anaplasma bovis TaxID=186733 RepID=UPI002FF139A2
MFDITRKSIEWGDRSLVMETGKIARQADGAVVVSYGGTSVLSTIVYQKAKELVDFLPLTVQFLAKGYVVGKIPGGFFKREGKPSDRETLISRLVDRSLRPLFPTGFCDEVAIVCNLLSYDPSGPPETVALIGAAAAVAISGVPFESTVAGARIGYHAEEKRYILNPSADDLSVSALDMFYARTDTSVLMVESEVSELPEDVMLGALKFAHENCESVIGAIRDFASDVGRTSGDSGFVPHDISALISSIDNKRVEEFSDACSEVSKKVRVQKLEAARSGLFAELSEKYFAGGSGEYTEQDILLAIKTFERDLMRSRVLDSGKRIDGRRSDQIRNIEIEIDLIQRAHGSALFTRGDTQALVITSLGTPQDEQIVDGFDGDKRERFLLHYNFPPYAVGEAAALRPPGRREIGHGKLAWRAIHAVLPSKTDFPYTIRVVSEITESDGSSSMATVCGASLALMDTGVPLKASVAGIAMGLIKDGDKYMILSDILGDEDCLGDMDFKVAGTREGITALQMDMKIKGIGFEIIESALYQAKEGRLHIMDKMEAVIKQSRDGVRENVPRMESIVIDKNKIKNVIGSGGKNIKGICEKTGVKIEISQEGVAMIYAVGKAAIEEAKSLILGIVSEPEVGKVYSGVVSELVKHGAFITFMGSRRGFVHISEIKNEHIESVHDVLAVGDKVKVLVVDVDSKDHVQLSIYRVDQETGEIVEGIEPYVSHHKRGNFSSSDAGSDNSASGYNSDGGVAASGGARSGAPAGGAAKRPDSKRRGAIAGGNSRSSQPRRRSNHTGGATSAPASGNGGAQQHNTTNGGNKKSPRFF